MPFTTLPAKANLNGTPTTGVFKSALGALYDAIEGLFGAAATPASFLAASRILDPQAIYNLQLIPTVGANALTMTLKSRDGTDLAAANPGFVGQRSATPGSGTYNLRQIAANLSTVISAGSTAGHASGVAAWIYWYLIDNGGAQELAWSSTFYGDRGIVTTTAEGGAGSADSGTLMYSTTARTDVPFRCIGRTLDSQAVAGTWGAAVSRTEMWPFIGGDLDVSAGLLGNVGIAVSVAGNALTFALKDARGLDPSPDRPVRIGFRSATPGNGAAELLEITTALSVVASSGSTLGTVSGQAHRIYLVIFNDAGFPRLGLYNPYNSALPAVSALDEGQLQSSTAEGGAGAADSAQVIYTGAAVTDKPMRILGYFESTQATAGTWATSPSKTQVMGPGVKRTGDVVQTTRAFFPSSATGTTTMPKDNTVPQITEGDEYMTAGITPQSAINLLEVEAQGFFAHSANSNIGVGLFRDANASAIAATYVDPRAASIMGAAVLKHLLLAGSISATIFRVRAGSSAAGTLTFNGEGGTRQYGGVLTSYTSVREVFV